MMEKFEFNFDVNIYRVSSYDLKWYQRDAKRIMQRKNWNSRKYQFRDVAEIFTIRDKKYNEISWLVEHKLNCLTGEVRIIPKRRVKILYWYPHSDLVKIKRRTKKL